MRLFLSAGESSGDAYAAELIRRLPGSRVEAVGGRRAREAGAILIADSRRWGAMGIFEALKVAPRVLGGLLAARRALRRGPPGVFVPIDYGFFNIKLARHAKALGWKVLYFIPPGSWRRDRQARDLGEVADVVVTPFPWSAEILRGQGVEAHFDGHPLLEMIGNREVPRDRELIALLPGSREHEVHANLPTMARAVEGLSRVAFAVASTVDPARLAERWRRVSRVPAEFSEDRYDILRRADRAILCSGTATLEAALCGCPSVVMYRGSKAMEIEYRLRKPTFDAIALPNLILGHRLVPELIQWDATPERLRQELDALADGLDRERQLKGFAELRSVLKPETGLSSCARRISELGRTIDPT